MAVIASPDRSRGLAIPIIIDGADPGGFPRRAPILIGALLGMTTLDLPLPYPPLKGEGLTTLPF